MLFSLAFRRRFRSRLRHSGVKPTKKLEYVFRRSYLALCRSCSAQRRGSGPTPMARRHYCHLSWRLTLPVGAALLCVLSTELRGTIVNITTALDGNKLNLSTIEVTSGTGNPNRVF